MSFKFEDKLNKEKNNLMVVDALNLAFRWKHSGKLKFVDEYVQTVHSLANSYGAGRVIITADQGSSSYRKEIYPEYKANRKAKFAEQTEEEREAFNKFFEEYERTIEELGKYYPVLRFKNVEADDIVAYIVQNRHKMQYKSDHTWLISSDKDYDLLISDKVSRFSYVTRKEITLENWSDHYKVPIGSYICTKVLEGDMGDNIPGIPGIGPVKAKSLIEQYGSAYDIYDALPIASKYKYIQNLNEHADRILLNYQLMDLVTYSEEAIGAENTAKVLEVLEAL